MRLYIRYYERAWKRMQSEKLSTILQGSWRTTNAGPSFARCCRNSSMRAATSAMLSAAFSCRRQPGRLFLHADFTAFQGTVSSRCVS